MSVVNGLLSVDFDVGAASSREMSFHAIQLIAAGSHFNV
jgi:hypothetical protein